MNYLFVPNHEANVLVVGDVILDRYVYGDTTRISPEAPVPVVQVNETKERPGGAGNVALNIRNLGINVCLVGITGKDTAADLLRDALSNEGVECVFAKQVGFPTTTKLRVLSQHQQLIRLDYEVSSDQVDTKELEVLFNKHLGKADTIVLSDYAKGSLANINHFIQQSRKAGKRVLVDPKGIDFKRYQGASLITPNLKEFEAVVGGCPTEDAIASKGMNLLESLSLEALLITQGENGMTLFQRNDTPIHLRAHIHEVFDVTGAGDTVIATLAAALASGHDLVHATSLANRAAGLVVEKLGAATVSTTELNNAVVQSHVDNAGIIDKSSLKSLLDDIRSEGKKIVMTNGCFDILHAGHVNYLKQAKALGDYLIVAVNDDDSVFRLKGKNRPINCLEHRLAVLDALESVDWVISFSEDTPESLINELIPDVLVKGGDYKPDEVAGAEIVKQNEGEVKIIPIIEGCSTSQIIKKLSSISR